jgi:serine/threonine-protein kinase RsbW
MSPAMRQRSRKQHPATRCNFEREKLILHFKQVIPSTVKAVERVVARVMGVAETMGCAQGELDKVELALHEALTNTIRHASGGDPKKKVAVWCLCDEAKGMLLVVRDRGPGFDPKKIPDPTDAEHILSSHGRGIFLMQQLMDEVRFEEGGRQVVMTKSRSRR